MGGFNDPETNKKAQEKSLATRRKKQESKFAKLFEDEQKEQNLPVAVNENDVQVFKDLQPGFLPSIPQLKVLAIALSLEHGSSIRSWFKAAGLNRNDWYLWIRQPEFVSWWNKSFFRGIEQYRAEWVAIGLKRMNNLLDPRAFDYWKSVGEKIFGFISELKVKTDRTPEEEQLTKELVELYSSLNRERKTKIVDGQVIDVETKEKQAEQLEKELKEIEMGEKKI